MTNEDSRGFVTNGPKDTATKSTSNSCEENSDGADDVAAIQSLQSPADDSEKQIREDRNKQKCITKRKKDASKTWVGFKRIAKSELEQTDEMINQTVESINKSLDLFGNQNKAEMDDDTHYCMSLVTRMRRLDPRRKAMARSSIEKVLFDL